MAITFRYVHVPRQDGSLRKAPYIYIYARTKEGRLIKVVALLDTGADTTVVPKDLAELLGLTEGIEQDTGGIGGNTKVKQSRMQFVIKGQHETHQITVPVLILQNRKADVPLLLGRSGFFENFNITIRQNEEKITLKKVQSKKQF
ncbi:retroviral-like aspartic protease family protein [Candidatus Woesearchaeota archaeon]|nr:retroviral-like aspartic protease family protein [Candidatus Woesearchaeota archaeon]MBW2994684.1 retroviral-like aspartic protease family protein [Candidatus Woesearchaeota archaeon]